MRVNHGNALPTIGARARRTANVSLDARSWMRQSCSASNISRACGQGLAAQIADLRAARWRTENADALTSSDGRIANEELSLARYRRF